MCYSIRRDRRGDEEKARIKDVPQTSEPPARDEPVEEKTRARERELEREPVGV